MCLLQTELCLPQIMLKPCLPKSLYLRGKGLNTIIRLKLVHKDEALVQNDWVLTRKGRDAEEACTEGVTKRRQPSTSQQEMSWEKKKYLDLSL